MRPNSRKGASASFAPRPTSLLTQPTFVLFPEISPKSKSTFLIYSNGQITRRGWFYRITLTEHRRLSLFLCSYFQIVASRPKPRRGSGRRGNTARIQVLGSTGPSPAARARLANTAKGTATTASPQPVEKIVVSNLPQDVNEAQVKVRQNFFMNDKEEVLIFDSVI